MDEKQDILYSVSRFIIFVPIVIVFLAVYFQYSSPKRSAENSAVLPTVTPRQETGGFQNLLKQSSGSGRLDLNGPYQCSYSGENLMVNASIKNKKVYVEYTQNNETDYAVIEGDCGYKWEKGQFTGEKICGIGQFISLYETLSVLPFMNMDALFSMLETVNPSVTIAPSEISAISKSCVKQEVNDAQFTIPSNIQFQEAGTITAPGMQ